MEVRLPGRLLGSMRSHVIQPFTCLSSSRSMFECISTLLIHVLTLSLDFSNMLNSIRIGIMNAEISAAMKSLSRNLRLSEADITFM
jgi:hypothetical protein